MRPQQGSIWRPRPLFLYLPRSSISGELSSSSCLRSGPHEVYEEDQTGWTSLACQSGGEIQYLLHNHICETLLGNRRKIKRVKHRVSSLIWLSQLLQAQKPNQEDWRILVRVHKFTSLMSLSCANILLILTFRNKQIGENVFYINHKISTRNFFPPKVQMFYFQREMIDVSSKIVLKKTV